MRRGLIPLAGFLFCIPPSAAEEVIAEGRALIENGDVFSARELALRRAVARAVESQGAVVNAQTTIAPGVALESAQVRATGCLTQTLPVGETVQGNEIAVSVKVAIAHDGACTPACQKSMRNKISVTAFAMEFPEQLGSQERGSVASLTALELARFINHRQTLPAVFDTNFFPYVSPARAPTQWGSGKGRALSTAYFAHQQSAQYVLGGVYRDFGTGWRRRRIEIEAFLHDGANGAVLAQRKFSRIAKGNVLLGNSGPIGSPEFYADDLGKAWGAIYAEIAAWVEASANCLPFIARVVGVKDKQIQIDAGAESGISAGDTMSLHQWKEPPIRKESNEVLGREKFVRATVRIRAVYPNFSIGELIEAPPSLVVAPGDVLYAN